MKRSHSTIRRTPVATYSYDGLGRRVTEVHGSAQSNLYYSAQWQVLEERDGSGTVQMQYVWSPVYVDALVMRDRSTGGGTLNERLYVQQDANWNVTALVNTSGTVVERYVYSPYGQVTVLAADYTTLSGSAYAWQYLHQGGRLDSATGLYDFRMRDYSPSLVRWIENDPLGFNAGDTNTYRSEGNNPTLFTDPSGEIPVSFVLNVGLTAWDTYQVATGGITGEVYAQRMVFNVAALAIDAVTLGYGGALIRGGQWAARVSGVTRTLQYGGQWAMQFAWVARRVGFATNPATIRILLQGIAGYGAADGVYNISQGLQLDPCTGRRDWDRVVRGAFQVAQSLLALRALRAPNCFLPSTLVATETGLRPIGQIEAGERVWAHNFDSGVWQLCEVDYRHDASYDGPIVTLDVGTSKITATAYHPFWVVRGEELETRATPRSLTATEDQGKVLAGRWVNSHDVRAGDVLYLRGQGPVIVQGVEQRITQTAVCNLTIRNLHTFAVGEAQVLVHNTSGSSDPALAAVEEAWSRLPLRPNLNPTEGPLAGALVSTRTPLTGSLPTGDYLFVVDANGRLWVAPWAIDIGHASLLPAGAEVRAAGQLRIGVDGRVHVDTRSGHFMMALARFTPEEEQIFVESMLGVIRQAGRIAGQISGGQFPGAYSQH